MRLVWSKIFILFFLLLFAACRKNKEGSSEPAPASLTPYSMQLPSYFPQMVIPENNPLTLEGIDLGRKLYYDTLLSNNGKSCSSCHLSNYSFSSPVVNSMPHLNLGFAQNFLWNGKVSGTVEDIMLFEVDEFFNTDISKLNNSSLYRDLFKKVYKIDNITSHDVARALSQFIRVMVSQNSKFDKYLRHELDLNTPELRGFIIFNTEKGDCFHCHSIGLMTDNRFHNIGIDSIFSGVNLGRYNITGLSSDIGLFKSPTLRNVELTAPYMHDGRFATLEDVVEHYNSGVKLSNTLDPIMTKPTKQFGLQLSAQDKLDLVAFLKTLTDTTFTKNMMFQKQ